MFPQGLPWGDGNGFTPSPSVPKILMVNSSSTSYLLQKENIWSSVRKYSLHTLFYSFFLNMRILSFSAVCIVVKYKFGFLLYTLVKTVPHI